MTLLLVATALLAFPYIALEVHLPVAGRTFDVPVADLAALGLLLLLPLRRGRPVPLPGPLGFGLLVLAGLAALPAALDPAASAYTLLRKPVFLYLAWGVAFADAVARAVPTGRSLGLLRASAALGGAVLLVSSVRRIVAGDALWWAAIEGLTNNHKTVAVALAPALVLIWGTRRGRSDTLLAAGLGLALLASLSRAAWIGAAAGLAWVVSWRGRPLAERRWLVPAVVIGGVLAALYLPLVTGSLAQLDAARSRHSLDRRAWAMVGEHPWFGMGLGTNVRYEQVTFPDYRVNGVDAHGVLQKVASETGLVGLAGWLAGTAATALVLHARHRATPLDRALWATFVALHVNLLLSTETFSQTHWAVLGLVWGLSFRRRTG